MNEADYIDPKDLIKRLTVEQLCEAAEAYYHRMPDVTHLLAKPFYSLLECPEVLCNLGILLSGLRLGKSMTVLDFGAGSCWLSRYLNQLKLCTISLDCSMSALELGRKLFREHPIVGSPVCEPRFLHFNGHTIDLPEHSVDRVICFAAFHHVPNQREVLSEIYRVLKPGGIAGFSEAGIAHSRSSRSQYEMRNFTVLENDILMDEIKSVAEAIGFRSLYFRLVSSPDLDLDYGNYSSLLGGSVPRRVQEHLIFSTKNATVFFVVKGEYMPDSRNYIGLMHELSVRETAYRTRVNVPVEVDVLIRNTGTARWLHSNVQDIGVVKLGVHLFSERRELINQDYFRDSFDRDMLPGERAAKRITFSFDRPGTYILGLDLVAEDVCWFEIAGARPEYITVVVE